MGHFEVVCQKKQRDPVRSSVVQTCSTASLPELSSKCTPTARVIVLAQGKSLGHDALPDTGATDRIISSRLLDEAGITYNGQHKRRIVAANGSNLRCLGAVELYVQWQDHGAQMTAFVTPDISNILLPWHTLIQLTIIPWSFPYSLTDSKTKGIQPISTCTLESKQIFTGYNSMPSDKDVQNDKDRIVDEFSDVFNTASSFKPMKEPEMHIHL